MTRRAKFWTWGLASLGVLIVILGLVTIQILKSPWFANYVRTKIISVAQEATGGTVEIGSFAFDWRHLEATVTGFVLHGTEPSSEPPLFRARKIDLRLKLLAGWKHTVDLEYLGIDSPAANVIVFPDGRTNIPEPKVVKKSDKTALQTVVDLAIHKFEIVNGSAVFAQQAAGFNARGENLKAQLFYRMGASIYQGEIKVGALQLRPAGGQPLNASVDLPVEIGADRISLTEASLATPGSKINLTASLSNLSAPVIDMHLLAHVSLAEVQRTTGMAMDACKRDTPCYGEADVQARVAEQSVQISKASLSVGQTSFDASGNKADVQFTGKVALDEIGRLFRIQAEPRGEVALNGKAANLGTDRYSVSGNISSRGVSVVTGSTRIENVSLSSEVAASPDRIELHKLRVGARAAEVDGDASLIQGSELAFRGQLKNLRALDFEPQGRPVYDGIVSGNIDATGNLKLPGATGIHAQAQLHIAPGSRGVPVSGEIQAAFDGSHDTVQLGKSHLVLPHSRLDLSGVLGSRVIVDFSSTGLDDLLPALAMSSQTPPQAMPVTLHGGKVALHAEVTGPLESPTISAHLDADRFSVDQRPFDRLTGDFSASASRLAVTNASLSRQSLQAMFSGTVGMRQWSPENNSPLMLTLTMQHGDIADVLALAGQSDITARGALDMSAQITGTLGNPQGSAHITAANGAIYDQPFDKADADIELTDQLIRLASLDVTAQAAHLQASGTYNHPRDSLLGGRAQIHATGSGMQLAQIAALTKQHPGIGGSLQFSTDAAGDLRQNAGKTEFTLASVKADLDARAIRDPKQNYGDLTAHADTSGSTVTFNADSNLAGAAIKLTGKTALTKDYPSTADVSVQNLRLENALALAGESFPAKGLAGLNVHVTGTIEDPSAEGQLTLTAANIYNEPIDRLQASIQYSNQRIEIPSLRLAAPAGTIALNGSFAHPKNQFDTGTLDLHAQSDSLQLARIRNVQNQKPGIAGTLKLMADFAGQVKTIQGKQEVSVSKIDGNLSASGIAYNGHPFGDATLIAETKGSGVDFKADSNFASAAIHGEGQARLEGDYPVTGKLTLANVRYSNLRALFGDESIRPDFEALLEAGATISGPAKKPDQMTGNLQVTRLELSSSTTPLALKNDGTMAINVDHGSVRVQNVHLTGKNTELTVGGTASLTGSNPLNLTVKANTDLSLLEDIARDIHASGAVTMDTTIQGELSEPLVNGTLQLKDASVNLESIPNGISKANGVIALNGTGANIRNLTAESGGGKLTLSGFATRTGSTIRYAINAKADHVRTRYEGISIVNSATLSLNGTSGRSLISGNVSVERVAYNPQSDIGSMLSQLTQRSAPSVAADLTGPAASMRLAVRIRTAPAVRFETTMAQALQADADLNLVGTIAQPGLVGRIDITQGDLIFFGNEYTVDRGLIAFYDPTKIDPRLAINLETTVESVAVTLGVTGPMNDLKLSYHSDPPLRFDEIVGLLTSGKQPTSDPNIAANEAAPPQQSVANMGETAIVSQAVTSPLSSRLQRVFGVNQLSIDPTFASGSSLPQTRLTLQQRVANSITFTYSQDLSQSNSELVRVEWAVNPRFSAVATRDENGIFGVDFFYKKQFR